MRYSKTQSKKGHFTHIRLHFIHILVPLSDVHRPGLIGYVTSSWNGKSAINLIVRGFYCIGICSKKNYCAPNNTITKLIFPFLAGVPRKWIERHQKHGVTRGRCKERERYSLQNFYYFFFFLFFSKHQYKKHKAFVESRPQNDFYILTTKYSCDVCYSKKR